MYYCTVMFSFALLRSASSLAEQRFFVRANVEKMEFLEFKEPHVCTLRLIEKWEGVPLTGGMTPASLARFHVIGEIYFSLLLQFHVIGELQLSYFKVVGKTVVVPTSLLLRGVCN